jgi:hypothetical protein
MGTETAATPQLDLQVDGGEATTQEAKLAAELSQETPAPATEATTAAAATATTTTDAATAAQPAAAAPEPEADAPPAPAAAPAPVTATVATAAPIVQEPKPEPPKDFSAERKAVNTAERHARAQYEAGEIDEAAWAKAQDDADAARDALAAEQATFASKLAVWEDRQTRAAQQADADFNTTAAAWEKEHADFMKDPLRKQVMQQAIAAVDADTGGTLSPAELLQRAQESAFSFCRYTPPGAAAAEPRAAATAVAKATAARTPGAAPQTLATAPAAAPIERGANATFAELDGKDINGLEDAIARMSPAQLEQYLADAPGARTTGVE